MNEHIDYKNLDKRCKYPFVKNDFLDYCWSYALMVDGIIQPQKLKDICVTCEFFKGERDEIR